MVNVSVQASLMKTGVMTYAHLVMVRDILMKIMDETLSQWQVKGGDPAAKVTNLLKRKGYELIVLPGSVLASGERPIGKYVIEDSILNLRLNECLYVLENSNIWR